MQSSKHKFKSQQKTPGQGLEASIYVQSNMFRCKPSQMLGAERSLAEAIAFQNTCMYVDEKKIPINSLLHADTGFQPLNTGMKIKP